MSELRFKVLLAALPEPLAPSPAFVSGEKGMSKAAWPPHPPGLCRASGLERALGRPPVCQGFEDQGRCR